MKNMPKHPLSKETWIYLDRIGSRTRRESDSRQAWLFPNFVSAVRSARLKGRRQRTLRDSCNPRESGR